MNSIFDQNSDFRRYMQNKNSEDNSDNKLDTSSNPKNTQSEQSNTLSSSNNSPQETYILDLKSHRLNEPDPEEEVPINTQTSSVQQSVAQPLMSPTSPPIQARIPKKTSTKKIKKLNKLSEKPSFLKDHFRFILVSTLIFCVTFIGLNWSAYSKIFANSFAQILYPNRESPLTDFLPENKTLITDELEFIDDTNIPKLTYEVTPPGTRVILPKLNTNVPVVSMSTNTLIARDWDALEKDMQLALRHGVVHYPGTPYPNQSGNVVLTGHSSYYPWDPGRFKDVFAILHQAQVGDEVILFHNQQKYTYQITEISKVLPTAVEVLGDAGDDRLTLITCTPIGTNLKRLIVVAKPIKT